MECENHSRIKLSGEYLSYQTLIRDEESDNLTLGPAPEECDRAINAFISGEYIIVIDDQKFIGIESQITLNPNSRVEFIKILPLVGG